MIASQEGTRIRIEGRVTDGDGAPIPDAMLEIWQANAQGRYNHTADQRDLPLSSTFTGFGRIATDDDGRFAFTTVKPGIVPFGADREQAPHISIAVLGRGLNNHLYTRLYFDDESANAADPILARVPAERRATLVAQRVEDNRRQSDRVSIQRRAAGRERNSVLRLQESESAMNRPRALARSVRVA